MTLHPSAFCLHPLRIFLSYGHDANEEQVRRIITDLEKRGHDAWFDKNDIKFGDDNVIAAQSVEREGRNPSIWNPLFTVYPNQLNP